MIEFGINLGNRKKQDMTPEQERAFRIDTLQKHLQERFP